MNRFDRFMKVVRNKNLMIVFLLGFASGLPFLLTGGTFKLWLTRENVNIKTIGFFGGVSLVYSLKFIWAPLVDRFAFFGEGRRRSWMFLSQALVAIFLFAMGGVNPQENLKLLAGFALMVAFFSATQDLAIDAIRRELLKDEELGLGSALTQYGYRLAMMVSGGIGLGMVGEKAFQISWHQLYYVMAGLMALCMIITYFAPEPKVKVAEEQSLVDSVLNPLMDFLRRPNSWVILSFIFFYKLGDALSGGMLNPFYAQMQFSNEEIGLIAKTFGMASFLVGLFLGSSIIFSLGIMRSLMVFGILQGLSTASFALLTVTGPLTSMLAFVVVFEDITAGMGSAAFLAYISSITNVRYTATQFAILASVATLGRNFFSVFSGVMVESLGWATFFVVCGLIAVPGLVLLQFVKATNPPANPLSSSETTSL